MYKQKKAFCLITILLLSIFTEAKINISASNEKEKLCQEVFQKIANEHFFNNKDLSSINSEIFDSLVDQLDSQKIYFTEYEIISFRRKFNNLDIALNSNNKYKKTPVCSIDLRSSFEFINLYFNRLIEATNFQLK